MASRTTIARLRRFRTFEPRSVKLKWIAEPIKVVTIDWQKHRSNLSFNLRH